MAKEGGGNWMGAAIGAVASIVGALIGRSDQKRAASVAMANTDKTIAANKAESELAFQRSQQMWHLQNQYNSPQSQMARYGAAGLNSHLVYSQGNAGNNNSMPEYQQPDQTYRYQAPQYAGAITAMMPEMMNVTAWLQEMRLKGAQVDNVKAQTANTLTREQQAQQMIDYLREKNPKSLQGLDNSLSLFPYQQSMQKSLAEKAWRSVGDQEQEYNHKWGGQLHDRSGMFDSSDLSEGKGLRDYQLQELLQKLEAGGYKNKLLEAQSSWSDFDITNPQQLMAMALQGVLGGATKLRINQKSRQNLKRDIYNKNYVIPRINQKHRR